MEFKRTLTLSLFLHIGLFFAALQLSAGFSGGAGAMPGAEDLFVRLTEDTTVPAGDSSLVPAGDVIRRKEPAESARQKPVIVLEEAPIKEKEMSRGRDPVEDTVMVMDVVTTGHQETGSSGNPDVPVNALAVEAPATQQMRGDVIARADSDPYASRGMGKYEETGIGLLSPEVIERIGRAIDRVKTYPALARRRGVEGTVYIGFRIAPEGVPREIQILKSSGHAILDTATLNVVKKAAPYPYVESRIEVPVTYQLRD